MGARTGGTVGTGGGHKENISLAFYDIFELNTHVIDYELEQALSEVSSARQPGVRVHADENALNYADIILRFPKDSVNRTHVEKLRFNHEQMGVLNYVVHKYDLSVQDLCRIAGRRRGVRSRRQRRA